MPSKSHELYETISHKTAAAPYSLHQTEMPYGVEPALYLHWHNEMEFFLLLEGELLFHVEDESYNLHSGDGIFIPPGALHCADNTGTTPVTFRAFVLSPDFIFSPFDTNAYNTYILPILHNNLSYILVLRRQVDWRELILRYLQELFAQKL